MSLRARLVLALVVLFSLGMAAYGVASYRAFERSELQRLDEQVRASFPVVEQELRLRVDGIEVGRGGGPLRFRHSAAVTTHIVMAPGTYAELRAVDGSPQAPAIQMADAPAQPDLSGVGVPADGAMWTAASLDGDTSWRAAAQRMPDGRTMLVAMPMSSVEQALERLLRIELVAGGALLLALALGAWLVLRSGLRPLERIAATTRSITAGSLEQRVPTPTADTEVKQLATALNTMLDDLEGAFREREATEARLRRFLADASHELRTPLTSIQGYAELFRLGAEGDQQADLDVIMRRIEAESGRMRELVENLLALARLDEEHARVWEPVDLTVLAADACSDAAATDPDRPIELDAPAPVRIEGDPSHLRQAIGNLVSNALRHTPSDTRVEVAVRTVDHAAEVVVRDHGDGLDQEALQRAFERFWQADPSRLGVGAGLGLSIVQAVAAEHGGSATAANTVDGGAVFTFSLPLARPSHPPEADPAGDAEPSHVS